MTTTAKPPPPLEWHPAYRDKTWLFDWLMERGEFAHHHDLKVAFPRRFAWAITEPYPIPADLDMVRVLKRKRAWGPAPYVGRPFVYR